MVRADCSHLHHAHQLIDSGCCRDRVRCSGEGSRRISVRLNALHTFTSVSCNANLNDAEPSHGRAVGPERDAARAKLAG
jgi:hypothetical protein